MLTKPKTLLTLLAAVPTAFAAEIHLTPITTAFSSPIGIDYHEPTDSVAVSVNYAGGVPYNFELIKYDGSHQQFSSISGLTEEVKIATARSGSVFPAGTLFTGNGIDGQITKIAPDGSSIVNPWVDLPGAGNGLMRGSLYVDRTGVWGGDLLAATTAGELWRVDSAGTPTLVKDVNTHLEGLLTVPNDAAKYGPLAGKAIAGAEDQGLMYIFSPDGTSTTLDLDVNIEDIDLIPANENFFGVAYGTSRILGAPASEFASMAGDILLTQEFGSGSALFRLHWDGSTLAADAIPLAAGSAAPGQWEHVTFAPAGIVEIPPTNRTPDGGGTAGLTVLALGVLGALHRRLGRS